MAERYPADAMEYMRQNGLSGRMLNDFNWGGYLLWAFPEEKTFVDGRTDIFAWSGVLSDYVAFAEVGVDPKILDKYQIEYCLLRKGTPVTSVLHYLPGWTEIYSDDLAVVFGRGGRGLKLPVAQNSEQGRMDMRR